MRLPPSPGPRSTLVGGGSAMNDDIFRPDGGEPDAVAGASGPPAASTRRTASPSTGPTPSPSVSGRSTDPACRSPAERRRRWSRSQPVARLARRRDRRPADRDRRREQHRAPSGRRPGTPASVRTGRSDEPSTTTDDACAGRRSTWSRAGRSWLRPVTRWARRIDVRRVRRLTVDDESTVAGETVDDDPFDEFDEFDDDSVRRLPFDDDDYTSTTATTTRLRLRHDTWTTTSRRPAPARPRSTRRPAPTSSTTAATTTTTDDDDGRRQPPPRRRPRSRRRRPRPPRRPRRPRPRRPRRRTVPPVPSSGRRRRRAPRDCGAGLLVWRRASGAAGQHRRRADSCSRARTAAAQSEPLESCWDRRTSVVVQDPARPARSGSPAPTACSRPATTARPRRTRAARRRGSLSVGISDIGADRLLAGVGHHAAALGRRRCRLGPIRSPAAA